MRPGPTGLGETPDELRAHFGTSPGKLMLLNADMTRQTAQRWEALIPAGTLLCLAPDSCGTDV